MGRGGCAPPSVARHLLRGAAAPNASNATEAYKELQGGKKLQGVEVLHSLLADHAERLLQREARLVSSVIRQWLR